MFTTVLTDKELTYLAQKANLLTNKNPSIKNISPQDLTKNEVIKIKNQLIQKQDLIKRDEKIEINALLFSVLYILFNPSEKLEITGTELNCSFFGNKHLWIKYAKESKGNHILNFPFNKSQLTFYIQEHLKCEDTGDEGESPIILLGSEIPPAQVILQHSWGPEKRTYSLEEIKMKTFTAAGGKPFNRTSRINILKNIKRLLNKGYLENHPGGFVPSRSIKKLSSALHNKKQLTLSRTGFTEKGSKKLILEFIQGEKNLFVRKKFHGEKSLIFYEEIGREKLRHHVMTILNDSVEMGIDVTTNK